MEYTIIFPHQLFKKHPAVSIGRTIVERLMIMGNFMLLCEFDPDQVYRWFMEMYIDAEQLH